MPVTMLDVVRQLSPDEADLRQAAAALGPEALPYLEALVRGPDTMLAAKSVHVAAWLQDPRSLDVLRIASTSPQKMVRVAAATAAAHLTSEQAGTVLSTLLTDDDAECRQIAIASMPLGLASQVQVVLEMLALTDPYPFIREMASKALVTSPKQDVGPKRAQ